MMESESIALPLGYTPMAFVYSKALRACQGFWMFYYGKNWHFENTCTLLLKDVPDMVEVVPDIDALANSICHPRMLLSESHDFGNLKTGFPIRNVSGMTNVEGIFLVIQCQLLQNDKTAPSDYN